jgi:hypothetical protein
MHGATSTTTVTHPLATTAQRLLRSADSVPLTSPY